MAGEFYLPFFVMGFCDFGCLLFLIYFFIF